MSKSMGDKNCIYLVCVCVNEEVVAKVKGRDERESAESSLLQHGVHLLQRHRGRRERISGGCLELGRSRGS